MRSVGETYKQTVHLAGHSNRGDPPTHQKSISFKKDSTIIINLFCTILPKHVTKLNFEEIDGSHSKKIEAELIPNEFETKFIYKPKSIGNKKLLITGKLINENNLVIRNDSLLISVNVIP